MKIVTRNVCSNFSISWKNICAFNANTKPNENISYIQELHQTRSKVGSLKTL